MDENKMREKLIRNAQERMEANFTQEGINKYIRRAVSSWIEEIKEEVAPLYDYDITLDQDARTGSVTINIGEQGRVLIIMNCSIDEPVTDGYTTVYGCYIEYVEDEEIESFLLEDIAGIYNIFGLKGGDVVGGKIVRNCLIDDLRRDVKHSIKKIIEEE